jgi:methyl-coenzyme M reductase subunit C
LPGEHGTGQRRRSGPKGYPFRGYKAGRDRHSHVARAASHYKTSLLVLEAGTGVPESFPQASRGYGPTFGLNQKELEQIARHKIAVLHLGNVRSHVIHKTKEILAQVDIPAVVVAQCPMDMEDFAREGIKTSAVKPPRQKTETVGEVVDIVTGITRGATCTRVKLNTLAKVLNKHLAEVNAREAQEVAQAKKKKK